ncbi:MAG TPA: aldo/keto reductase [Longimicrobiales bacterium]|nr:aldo/keto reductase [Longimicrobiales bacterium]
MESATTRAAAAGTVRLGEVEVHRMGFGAMRLTGRDIWGPPADRAEAHRVLRTAVHELGVRFIDTADAYGPFVDEELIAEALHPYPDDLVIGTKGGIVRPGPGEWQENGRPEHLRQALDGSLGRLRLERIDVYQLHAPDPAVPLEDSLGELARLRGEGKIRHIGVSNFDVGQLERALEVTPFVSVQNRYNVHERAQEPVVEWCTERGVAFLSWRPVAAGKLKADEALDAAARRAGATPMQIALAWLLHRSPVMLPIPGTSSIDHLRENVAAGAIELTEEDLEALGR